MERKKENAQNNCLLADNPAKVKKKILPGCKMM